MYVYSTLERILCDAFVQKGKNLVKLVVITRKYFTVHERSADRSCGHISLGRSAWSGLPGQVCLDRTDGTNQQVQAAWQIRLDMSARTVQQGKVSWERSAGRVKPLASLDRTTWTDWLRQDKGEKSAGTYQPAGQVSLDRPAGKGHQGRSAWQDS